MNPRLGAGHHGSMAERNCQMSFADPGGSEQYNVLGALDEAELGELLDLRPRCTAREREVVALERLHRGQRSQIEKRLAWPRPAFRRQIETGLSWLLGSSAREMRA
jgi:hypothetical protein